MPTISERLRGDYENWALGSTGPRVLVEAADTIDALVAALEDAKKFMAIYSGNGMERRLAKIDGALAMARKGE